MGAENSLNIQVFLLAVLVYKNKLYCLTSVKPTCNYLEICSHLAL